MAFGFCDLFTLLFISCSIYSIDEWRNKKENGFSIVLVLGLSSKYEYTIHDIPLSLPYIPVLDDSSLNLTNKFNHEPLQIWNTINPESKFFIPYRIPLYQILKGNQCNSYSDVLFIGSETPRRVSLYNHLIRILEPHGFTVKFYKQKDVFNQNCKIVLNIHKEYKRENLEMARIEQAAILGKCIISEPSENESLDAIYEDTVIFTDYTNIPKFVMEYLQSPSQLYDQSIKAYRESFLRQTDIIPFKNVLNETFSFANDISKQNESASQKTMSLL
jgi:hypothetical protein